MSYRNLFVIRYVFFYEKNQHFLPKYTRVTKSTAQIISTHHIYRKCRHKDPHKSESLGQELCS